MTPGDVVLVVEVVSPGSETTDRIVKADQYARADQPDREGEVFTGLLKMTTPFVVEVDLGQV